ICQNIKQNRAAVSPNTISDYFNELGKELQGVSPQNILNYDQTNLSDDSGKKTIIAKQGCKYPERLMNSTKSFIFDDGTILPPYIVYRTKQVHNSLAEDRPQSAIERNLDDSTRVAASEDHFSDSPYADEISLHDSDSSLNLASEGDL
ncbi:hypothetical protein ILUMI_17552, partial [Ignelater luminosus]